MVFGSWRMVSIQFFLGLPGLRSKSFHVSLICGIFSHHLLQVKQLCKLLAFDEIMMFQNLVVCQYFLYHLVYIILCL